LAESGHSELEFRRHWVGNLKTTLFNDRFRPKADI